MKPLNITLKILALLAIVGTGLAFKPNTLYGAGSVFCSSTCASSDRISYRLDPSGAITDPCSNGAGHEYVLTCDNTCVQTGSNCHFTATPLGK